LLTTQFNHTADDLFMANLLSWSPNGRYLALIGHDVVSGSMRLYLMDFEEQVIMDTCQEIMANQKHIWSPDEMQLVYYGDDRWYVADMNTFAVTELSSLMSNWYDIPLVWMN
jgi:Tol biopolymer transport system component